MTSLAMAHKTMMNVVNERFDAAVRAEDARAIER